MKMNSFNCVSFLCLKVCVHSRFEMVTIDFQGCANMTQNIKSNNISFKIKKNPIKKCISKTVYSVLS